MAPDADGTRRLRPARTIPPQEPGLIEGADVAALLRSLEERLLSAEGRASPELINRLLADDFQEIGSSGDIFGKRETLDGLAEDGHIYERTTSQWSVRALTDDVALVTYKVVTRDATDGSASASRRSSTWTYRDGRWQMVFHQGTRLDEKP